MPVRMIASDLDGTLLTGDHLLSTRTVEAIRTASDAGLVVVAATGRSYLTAEPLLRVATPAMRWAVCSNGASLFNLRESRVAVHHFIDDATLLALESLWADRPDFALAWEHSDGFGAEKSFFDLFPLADGLHPEPGTAARPARTGIIKLLVGHRTIRGLDLVRHIAPLLPATVEVATSGAPFVEITGAGVNKAYGLSKVAAQLGIDASDVVVFGDNHNDIPMFRWAGHSVAMANAVDEVQAIADEVTADHRDDGVAQFIERLLGSN